MENYFNYFTEIEEHFQRRRGGGLILSTLDWALIETWKDAGIPLEAVLRGIDSTFDKYDHRPSKSRKINGLAYCAQEVLAATEEMKEAAVGTSSKPEQNRGFNNAEIIAFLRRNATELETVKPPARSGISVEVVAREISQTLNKMAVELETGPELPRLKDLERKLTVLEDKLFAVLLAGAPDEELVAIRTQADRELAPYRRKMPASQIEQLMKQYLNKKLLEKNRISRLSLFYM